MKKRIGAKALFVSGVLLVWAVFSPKFAKAEIDTLTEVPFGNVALGTSKMIPLVITNLDQTNSTSLRFTFSYNECTDFTVDPLSIPLVGPDEAAEVQVTFKPIILGACSADFFVYYHEYEEDEYGNEIKVYRSVKVLLKGEGVEEDAGDNEPPGDLTATVVIDGHDTGVPNMEYKNGRIQDWIDGCASPEKWKRGRFLSCLAHLINRLKNDGLITHTEMHALKRHAARRSFKRDRGWWVENDAERSEPGDDVSSTVVIGGHDTGVPNMEYENKSIQDWIDACASPEKKWKRGWFVRCLAHLIYKLKKDGLITDKQKHALRRAERPDIPKRRRR